MTLVHSPDFANFHNFNLTDASPGNVYSARACSQSIGRYLRQNAASRRLKSGCHGNLTGVSDMEATFL
jgi:hypothetical protein